ncbi:hypothetical protein SAMN05216238_107103 [Lentibacillus persicus]|uniref:Uncharacterized protein n=1 Tax=Lentibacillus persicus TaxID=640948 RepID=A0A1I1X4N4_9BACI|nr:hypothetical protein [Lentibacillus persicus]SFE02374.1 hypothetical protein SAMN05216238_107103 [Lentibacillus persicus]
MNRRRERIIVNLVARGLRVVIALYALLYFITFFVDNSILVTVHAILGFMLLVLAVVHVNVRHIKLPLFLFSTGFLIMLVSGGPFLENMAIGLRQMSNIIGLLAVVPVIGWVLRSEPYIEDIIGFAHNWLDTSRKFYFGVLSFTHIISYFLLFGAIPMMYQFVDDILKNQRGEAWEHFKGTALLRSFALSTLWVISIPSFAYAVEAMNASLPIAILQGFIIALAGLLIAVVFSYFEEKKYGIDVTAAIKSEIAVVLKHASNPKIQKRRTIEFGFLFITLFGSIFFMYEVTDFGLMILIPIVIVIWAGIYFLVKKRIGRLGHEVKEYYRSGLASKAYQFSVLTSAGVMIHSLNQTGIGTVIIDGVYAFQEVLPFFNMLYFLPLILIILGFMGLGPLTVMVLVAGILESISLPYPPELIVLAVTSGSAISILLSPLIMPVIVLSAANGVSPFKNGLKFNYKFAIVLYVLVQVYVQSMV